MRGGAHGLTLGMRTVCVTAALPAVRGLLVADLRIAAVRD